MTANDLRELYRINYFYDMIRSKGWSGYPKRQENTLARIEKEGNRIANKVIGELIEIYDVWIEDHEDLNSRKTFEDYYRVNVLIDGKEGSKNSFLSALENFQLYAPDIDKMTVTRDLRGNVNINYDMLMADAISRLMFKSEVFDGYLIPVKNTLIKELEKDRKELVSQNVLNKVPAIDEELEVLKSPEWRKAVYRELKKDANTRFVRIKVKDLFRSNVDIGAATWEIAEYLIRPYWEDDPEDPRYLAVERVVEMKNKLETTLNSDLSEKFANINLALNVMHNSGPMMDHVQTYYPQITPELLTELSNMDTSEWDRELKEIGVLDQPAGYKIAKKGIKMFKLSTRVALNEGDENLVKIIVDGFISQAGDKDSGIQLLKQYLANTPEEDLDPQIKYVKPYITDEVLAQIYGESPVATEEEKKMSATDMQILKATAKARIEYELDSLEDFAVEESKEQAIRESWNRFYENLTSNKPTMLPREYRYIGKFLKDPEVLKEVTDYLKSLGYNVEKEFGYQEEEKGMFDDLEVTKVPHLDDIEIDDVKVLGLADLSRILGDVPMNDDRIDLPDGRLFVVDYVDYDKKEGVVRRIADLKKKHKLRAI